MSEGLSDEVESGFEEENEPIDLTGVDAKSQSEERINEDAEISITGCLTNDKDGEIIAVESRKTDSIDNWQPPTPPADPLAPIVVADGYETCGVCLDPWGYDDNQILYCDGCDLPVHQHCYGVPEIPDGDWYCQACSAQLKKLNGRNGGTDIKPAKGEWWGNTKECELCLQNPKKIKWALSEIKGKRGDKEKRFCHVLCAQYVSETWFKDNATCSLVENVDNVQPRRRYGTCSFCGDNDGVKVLCSIKSCTECFHAPCGLAWGCELDDVAPLTETYSNRVVYCIAHRPKVIEAGTNARLKMELKQSQNIKAGENRNSLGWNWKATGAKKNRSRPKVEDRRTKKKPEVKTKSRSSIKKKKKRRLVAQLDSESDTESDIVLPEVDAEVLSQSYRHVKTRSSGPAPLEPLSIKAARKFAPATREPIKSKKKAQKRKREHSQSSTSSRKKTHHAAVTKSAAPTLSIPKNISNRGLPNSEDGKRKLAAFEQRELARLSKKSQIRDSLPKHLLSNARKISSEPPPLEPRGGEKKKAKLISSFDRRQSEKPRIRSSYGRSRNDKDRGGRDPRRRDSYDRRDRDDRGRDRDRRDRDRERRSSPPRRSSSDLPSRAATKRPPQRPPSTIPVTINAHADPRKKMDPRQVITPMQAMDPRKAASHRAPPPPPPKPFVVEAPPPVIPTNIGYAPPASRPIIVNQPITSFSMPPPTPSKPIWAGKMCKSPACEEFGIYLKLLAGEETITELALANDADLKLKGRIRFDTLASYLPAMKLSSRKKIFLVEVHPAGGNSETQSYNKFCQYYRELRRGAVIDLEKSHGVTMYIMPVIDDISQTTLSEIHRNFNCFPPKGVMWGVVVQFPEVLTALKGDIVERHVRAQPSAKEIKSRVITKNSDPRAADPRARAAPTQVDDEVMEALRKLQELG